MSAVQTINPFTGETIQEWQSMDFSLLRSTTAKARSAFAKWEQVTVPKRVERIRSALNYFEQNREAIAADITAQMGRPLVQSRGEIDGLLERFNYLCDIAPEVLQPDTIARKENFHREIMHEPHGVVLIIAAWNYPLLIAVNVVVPAVLSGNSVAIKHSSLTPLCGKTFEDAFKFAGAPDGLVTSLIMEHQTTEQVIQSGLIQHLAFTGSVTGGRRVKTSVGNQFIETGLELGGKDPAYIREDANVDKVIPTVMDGVFYNAGQSCCAVERIYVHHTLFDTFLSGAIQYMNALNIGNPMEETTDLGPIAQLSGVETAIVQINDAEAKGADVHYYSGNVPEGSHFLAPAILTNVNHQMDIMQEESFGPIVGIMPVQSDADAIKLMNDSPYGLTASVWTKDAEKAIEIGNQIETGTFYMNRCDVLDPALPWVGVKDSGKGCTLSTLGIQEMTRPKAFNMKFD